MKFNLLIVAVLLKFTASRGETSTCVHEECMASCKEKDFTDGGMCNHKEECYCWPNDDKDVDTQCLKTISTVTDKVCTNVGCTLKNAEVIDCLNKFKRRYGRKAMYTLAHKGECDPNNPPDESVVRECEPY